MKIFSKNLLTNICKNAIIKISLIVFVLISSNIISQSVSTLKMKSATINNVSISTSNPLLVVKPGQSITGTVNLEANNIWSPTDIVPLAGTPGWGDPKTSYWGIKSSISHGITTHTANVNLTAPSKLGIYYIFIAYGAEMTYANVMSLTNWKNTSGNNWNDGYEIAYWNDLEAHEAIEKGYVETIWLSGQPAYSVVKIPAIAIILQVDTNSTYTSLVFDENFDNYPNWNYSSDPTFSNFDLGEWICGDNTFPKPWWGTGQKYVQIQDGILYGYSSGYATAPIDGFTDREINLNGENGFSLEFRGVSASSWPNRLAVFLFSDYTPDADTNNSYSVKGYELNLYG